MKIKLTTIALLAGILTAFTTYAQDFSNKGTDFWVIYTGHIDGTSSRMALYITSDQNAIGTVSVGGNTINFAVTANQVTTVKFTSTSSPSNAIPYNAQTVGIGTNKGIHIISDKPIVVYAHILNSARSGSTLVLPTSVLGREYFVSSYKSVSSTGGTLRRSEFAICATQDATTVEITPNVPDANNTYAANVPFQVHLNKGDVFQYQSANDNDLTGTRIQSIASAGSACKPIAVFSGSTWTGMGCANASSGDNLYQQLFPFASWGKLYYTAPFINRSYDIFRILVQSPTTVVTVNGNPLPFSSLIGGRYYEINTQGNNTPRIIEADQPICVFQYLITQNCDGVNSDPEMVILNSVEQTLNDITVMSARSDLTPPATNITNHYLNIIFKTATFNTLRIDGAAPSASPQPIPGTLYSYIQQDVTGSTNVNPAHRITSDSGFICIAYGYGNVESYGYNAGTNLKDLYQFVSVQNQYATVNFPAACKNSPFYFSMTFPYQPTQIQWVFNGLFPDVTINNPVYDETWTVNGKQLYKYKLPTPYTIYAVGSYPIKVIAQNPTADGCSGTQEIDYTLQVFAPPVADFNFTASGCLTDSVHFFDFANTNGRPAILYSWDFGDGGTGNVKNPVHAFPSAGSFNVKYSLITDVGCLSDTVTKTVVISNPPVAKFGVAAPYCIGSLINFTDSSSVPTGGTLVKWYWNFGDGSPQVIATTNAPQTHSYATTGTYNVTLKVETSSGCQSLVFTKAVTIGPKPLASFSFGNACLPNGTMQFTDASSISDGTQSQFTYLWTFSDGGTSNQQNPTHVYNGAGPFTVTLQVTSGSGCVDDSVRTINTIYAQPQANFSAPTEVCPNATASFTDQSTAPNSSVTQWQWDFGDNTTSNQQNPTHNYSAAGTYTVTLTITSAVGCVSTVATKTVVVTTPPVAKFGLSSPNCAGKNITFTDSSTITTGTIVKWYWDFGDGSSQVVATSNTAQTHSYATAGTYNVTLKVETAGGCQSQVYTLAVVINPNPLASFNFGNACLPNGSMQFTNTSTISDGSQNSFTYLWTFSDGGTSSLQNPTHVYSSAGPFTANLQVTSNKGCIDDTVRTINTIYAQPQAGFTAPAEVCLGTTVNFTDQSTAANSSITQWQWNFGDNGTSTQQNPTHNYAAAGTYTVTLTATSAIGCVSTVATKTVIVNALPVADFNPSLPNCVTKDITFTDASTSVNGAVVKWTWDLGDGSQQVLTNNTPFTHAYAATGTYAVTLKVESSKGCVSTVTTKNVVVHPLPAPSFIIPDNCVNDPVVQFNDNSTIADGSQASFTYLWNFGDANSNAGNPNTSTAQNGQHRFVATGTYNVTLTVTSNNGCSASVTQPFTINGSLPQSIFTVNGGNQFCSNSTVSITNNSTVDFGRIIRLEVFWDYANDPTNKTVVNLPASGAVYNHTYPEFFAPATKSYTITVIAYSGTNCLSTSTQTITLKATPQIVFNPVNGICADVPSFQLTQASVINALPGSGVYSGTGVSATGIFNPATAGAGTHTIRYTYTGTNGCSNFKEQNIEVFPVPVVNAGPDKFVLQGGTAVLNGSATGTGLSYVWTPITGLNNPAVVQPIVSPTDDLTYTLTVTSSDGCTASDQVFVKLLKTPTIPNTFSPNGDGVHDKWEILYLESYPGCTVEIYNRYGQLVFQSKGYSRPWDGTFKGKDLPAGTYYYIIDPKNGRKQMAGFVDIIR